MSNVSIITNIVVYRDIPYLTAMPTQAMPKPVWAVGFAIEQPLHVVAIA
jgi:hypothetical protein